MRKRVRKKARSDGGGQASGTCRMEDEPKDAKVRMEDGTDVGWMRLSPRCS